ncbi:alanine--tRNA ligase, cytoplasmic-like isoform X2 [Apostichopus japonicus]|uniref:alanine--tRNA ligase, cytoplasmic-like isoform X2 n=1 Tax=Stichopus japonicus TaxID=307972 RepID=UPI003AB5E199
MTSLMYGSSRAYFTNVRKILYVKSGRRCMDCNNRYGKLSKAPRKKFLLPPLQLFVSSAAAAEHRFFGTFASTQDIRNTFIEYFTSNHNHTFVPSSSVLPMEDSSLLFTNAGMNQFKDIIQGTSDPRLPQSGYKRVVNSQKCIRAGGKHNDLEDVGQDTYHHTFFEMLGNWSFGDYFKHEACSMAWDLLINVYKLPAEKLYVTYFKGDDNLGLPPDQESRDIWLSLGEPSGLLRNLPLKHVDTGLGLERLVAILQGKKSNYDTDLFQPLMQAIQHYTGARAYSGLMGSCDIDLVDTSYRVIADHIRMLSVAIADGGQPDYYKRGYILKRVIRRALRFAVEKLDSPPGLLSHLVPVVVDSLGMTYPELQRDPNKICYVLDQEEKQFSKTLKKGQKFLLKTFEKLGPEKVLPGDLAWKMYDGFGFPIDLTSMIADEHGVKIDMVGFERTRKRTHKITSQGGIKNTEQTSLFALKHEDIVFLQKSGVTTTKDDHKYNYSTSSSGKYDFPHLSAKILAIKSKNDGIIQSVSRGEQCGIILDRTNYYAEQGGQEWDEGWLLKVDEKQALFSVTHTQSYGGYVLHVGEAENSLKVGMEVKLNIDQDRRLAIMKNHTATHILNFALREIIPEAEQRGSLVAPDKLRFDFNAKGPLSRDEVAQLTSMCNDIIQSDLEVFQESLPLSKAQSIPGVRAMFQQAGHDPVYLVSIGQSLQQSGNLPEVDGRIGSVEFCGGTHVINSRHIGQMVISSQKLASGGIRRLTALTGEAAEVVQRKADALSEQVVFNNNQVEDFLQSLTCEDIAMTTLQKALYNLESEVDNVPFDIIHKEQVKNKITALRERLKKHERKMKKVTIFKIIQEVSSHPDFLKHSRIVKLLPDGLEPRDLRSIGTQCQRNKLTSSLLLISRKGDKVHAHCISSREMVDDGFSAIMWAQRAAELFGGTCSGNEHLATITGHYEKNLEDAVKYLS